MNSIQRALHHAHLSINHIIFAAVVIVSFSAIGYGYAQSGVTGSPITAESELFHMNKARSFIALSYDLSEAEFHYKKVLAQNPLSADALYELSRLYFVQGDFKKSLNLAQRYITQYPSDARIYYIAGLSAGYDKQYTLAEQLFTAYMQKNPDSSWQSRLDLAWVYFQEGKYTEAESVLIDAQKFGADNPWILTSLGAVAIAQGDTVSALVYLKDAKKFAREITPKEWYYNYSFNNPAKIEESIATFISIIDMNISLAQGKKIPADIVMPSIAGISNEGVQKGIVVSACGESCGPVVCETGKNSCGASKQYTVDTCNITLFKLSIKDIKNMKKFDICDNVKNPPKIPDVPTNLGEQCSSVNACGVIGTGTVQCDGSCSPGAALPPGFGESCTYKNDCGKAIGTIGCNGACNVKKVPKCNGEEFILGGGGGNGGIDNGETGGFGFGKATAEITARPILVRPGSTSIISWQSYETKSCEVTGNGDKWSSKDGEKTSSPIPNKVVYTLTCKTFNNQTITDSVTINLIPNWQEI
jgi:tetratricopeptide (TPR) repeat protein